MGKGPQGDAIVTNVPGFALGVLTADCAPVLLADVEARLIGAAHAGWKGALAGVIESAVAAMQYLGAERNRILAAVGPCISQTNYEVGSELRTKFVDASPTNAVFFIPSARSDYWRLDLGGYVGTVNASVRTVRGGV